MLLNVDDLTVEIPTPEGPAPILEGLSFGVEAGESLGLVGESGCGKSMTALALMGLLPDRARVRGRIHLQGQSLLSLSESRWCRLRGRRIGMIFQEPMTALNPVKTIGAQIGEGLRWHLGLSRGEAGARARRLLDRVGLPGPRFSPDLYPHQLSGGQRQRVVIAMALACEPALLIADEPTTALDVTIQAQILDLIQEVVAETGMGLLLITHDLGVVAETTDRVNVMYAGRIVESGATASVFARLAHPYSRGLFAAMPQLDLAAVARRRLATIAGVVPDPTAKPPGCVFADRCFQARPRCRDAFPSDIAVEAEHRVACYYPITEPVQV